MVGTARRTAPTLRALINNSEGWPRARRSVWRVASPGPEGRSGRRLETLAHPLSAQHQPLHRRAQVEGQHPMARCGVGSEQPRRDARSQVTLQDAVDLLATHLCLYHRIISSPGRSRFQPGPCARLRRPASSEGQFQLQFHSRQRLFAQRLPDSDEPVFSLL